MTAFPYNSSAQGGFQYLLDTFKFPSIGEITFECDGSERLWQVPAGITSISAVLIGGGAGGGAGGGQTQRSGGGGGGLRYINGMVVVPGETLKIKAGLGGTGHSCNAGPADFANNGEYKLNEPGFHSYIASDNNANVTARAGIGGTIIVIAEGGGHFPAPTLANINNEFYVTLQQSQANAGNTTGIATSGGTGTAPGIYTFGTIGGGNGGHGGRGDGGNGGGQDGGGGGAAGWVNGTRGGNGAWYSANNAASYVPPTNGAAGGGGGGNVGAQGGAHGAGGGGGTGIRWGIGPNGFRGSYNTDPDSGDFPGDTPDAFSQPGQGGSFGRDGKATGNELVSYAGYFSSAPYPSNYPNGSDGNGVRGFSASLDAIPDAGAEIPSKPREGGGGYYGGGGGGAQSSGTGGGFSGEGACGVVRILWVARTQRITRNYPGGYNTSLTIAQNISAGWSGISTTNILTSYGFPTLPPAAGGVPDFFGP